MNKIFISDNKDIGKKCKNWAKKNLPENFIIVEDINECNIFISVQYDKILKKEFIENKICYNFHPAILPDYAGVGLLSWVLINNEKYHGVTLLMIDENIDTGDIIEINKFKISDNETLESLYLKTMDSIFYLFKKSFNNLLFNNYIKTKQNFLNRKLYTYKNLDNLLNLTKYMRSTYFKGKSKPYFYNIRNEKIMLNYE
jgi:methionyl-tRNA formyltransferase